MRILILSLTFALTTAAFAAPKAKKEKQPPGPGIAPFFTVTPVLTPPLVDPQVGGMDVTADGRLVVAFHRGEVGIYTPKTQDWKIFAQGLHEPLGVLVEKDGSILVMQRPELTRLRDTTGAGVADSYETVWDGFGMSGNYHEFAFGPVRGPNGKLYVTLNLASNGGSIREEIRGEWSPIGVPREKFYTDWKNARGSVGRMYSRVAWRGWVMEVDPATGIAAPFASGMRSPDGINFDSQGNLLVSDNQGDWRGTCELFIVKRGGFYGHPASLVWRKDWDGTEPLKVPVARLDELRTPAAIWFPYGSYANSVTQMLTIPKTPAWGPFGGQMLIGEMNAAKIFRMLPEEVDGVWQGATVALMDSPEIKRGLHRFAFIGDTLYAGRTHLSWAGGEGISAIKPTGRIPFDPLTMRVTPKGFRFEFTEALDPGAGDPALWSARRYAYAYHPTYGSPEINKADVRPVSVKLSADRKTAEVELSAMTVDSIYDFDLAKIKSATGAGPLNPHIAYTLRRVPKK